MKFNATLILLGFVFVGLLPSHFVLAQEAVRAEANVSEAEIAVKAKKRLYPGGKDESDLKVQSQVNNPTRKMAPTLDLNSGAPATEPNSDD